MTQILIDTQNTASSLNTFF